MATYEQVREFCIQKLARILYDCVVCSHSARDKLDWFTAQKFVDGNKATVDDIRECFQRAIAMLPAEQVQDFEAFDRVCGRAVWDKLYQPLQRALQLPYRPIPQYTYIRFS